MIDAVHSNYFCALQLGSVLIIATFGVMAPLLGIVMICANAMETFTLQVVLGRFLMMEASVFVLYAQQHDERQRQRGLARAKEDKRGCGKEQNVPFVAAEPEGKEAKAALPLPGKGAASATVDRKADKIPPVQEQEQEQSLDKAPSQLSVASKAFELKAGCEHHHHQHDHTMTTGACP